MLKILFTGTGSLFRFMLRRDRVRLSIWVISIAVFTIILAPYYGEQYATDEARAIMAETMGNPAVVMLCGPVYSAEDYHEGAMMANETLLFVSAFIAVMNIFLIARHTRKDEEKGRLEVIRSLPVGKLANIMSALFLSFLANIVLTLAIGFGIGIMGITNMDFVSAMNFSLTLGVVGIFFATVTALCCQLTANTRTATGFALALAGGSYLLRGIGDTSDIKALTVTSPFGLAHMTEAFVQNHWQPILIMIVASIILTVVTLILCKRRDLGTGLFQAKQGRRNASPVTSNSMGLSLRMIGGSFIIWVGIILVIAGMFGSLFGDIEAMVESNEMIAASFVSSEFTITEMFLSVLIAMFAITGAFPSVSFLMKLRSEERTGHTELLLSRSVGRMSLFGGYFTLAILNAVILSAMGGITMWAIASNVAKDVPALSTIMTASFLYIPAMWLMVGVSATLIGLFPKITGVAYTYLGYSFVAWMGVNMFGFPEWLDCLSPFSYVPNIPVEEANPLAIIVLIVITVILSVVGFVGYRKRDAVFY